MSSWADSEGETGKSQVIWVSIGNKQLDTTTPLWKKLDPPPPPPPPENVRPPLEPWKRIVFFESNLWTSVKYVEDKKNVVRAFLCQIDLNAPPPPLKKIPASAHGPLTLPAGKGVSPYVKRTHVPQE